MSLKNPMTTPDLLEFCVFQELFRNFQLLIKEKSLNFQLESNWKKIVWFSNKKTGSWKHRKHLLLLRHTSCTLFTDNWNEENNVNKKKWRRFLRDYRRKEGSNQHYVACGRFHLIFNLMSQLLAVPCPFLFPRSLSDSLR